MVKLANLLLSALICFMSLHSNLSLCKFRRVRSDLEACVEATEAEATVPRPLDTKEGLIGSSTPLLFFTTIRALLVGIEEVGGGGGGSKMPFLGLLMPPGGPVGVIKIPVESK